MLLHCGEKRVENYGGVKWTVLVTRESIAKIDMHLGDIDSGYIKQFSLLGTCLTSCWMSDLSKANLTKAVVGLKRK